MKATDLKPAEPDQEPPAEQERATEPVETEEPKGPLKSASTILVELAMRRYRFGVSDGGEAFAVPKEGPRVVQLLRGGKTSLRSQLARAYFQAAGKAPPQQALADALLVIQGMAEDTEPVTLYQRVARHAGALWLDLGDRSGKAVRITSGGWTVEQFAPVLFRRTPLSAELPEPTRGGDLDELWSWLNVTKEDRPLLAAWLVCVLYDYMPHPVLGLFGEQGTGKTTAAKVLTSVLDPSPVPVRKPPKDAESWIVAAAGSWVVALDNLTSVPDWLSDSLCRAVTGEGDVRRKLYSDGDFAVFAYRRCIIVNGIDLGALNGDLAERLLAITLDLIAEENRRDEEDLWPQWAAAHPRILGAVLDLAASVASHLPGISLPKRPRMADFAKILAAVDKVGGTDGFKRYMQAQRSLATDALTGDPFVTAMAEKITGTFEGTSRELLDLVTPTDAEWRRPKEWPANARAVTTRMHKQAPVMRKAGWIVEDDDGANHDNAVRWSITPPAGDSGDSGSPNSQTRNQHGDQHEHREPGASQPAGRELGTTSRESTANSRQQASGSRPARKRSAATRRNTGRRESASQASQDSGPSQDESTSHGYWLASGELYHPDCRECAATKPSTTETTASAEPAATPRRKS